MKTAEERRAEREAYVRRVVEEAPPLPPERIDQIVAILRPGRKGQEWVESEELTAARNHLGRAKDDLIAAEKGFARALTQCGICMVPESGHRAQFGSVDHGFRPLSPKQVMASWDGRLSEAEMEVQSAQSEFDAVAMRG